VLVGRFVRLKKDVEAGIVYGRWYRFDGTIGAIHGFWGQKKDGSKVFMAYYYAADGSMQGLLGGRYETFAGGHRLVGQWEKKDGSVEGWIAAKLVLPTETALRGGLVHGRWGRSDCPTEEGTVDDQLANDFDTSDEPAYFGQQSLFEDTETVDDDPNADATLDQTDDTLKALLAGNSPFVVLRIGWGFLSYHPFFAPATGGTESEPMTISVNRGGIKVLRLIRFDTAADQMLPPTDPQRVDLASVTGPHFDGITLLWVLGPGLDEPTLSFTSSVHSETISLAAMASAPSAPHHLVIDVPGTRKSIFVNAMVVQRQKAGCDKGFVAGRWIHLPFAANKGIFIGRWINKNGLNAGYVYGVWGDGEILGKVIGKDWKYKGNLNGTVESTEQTWTGDYIENGSKTGSVTGMYRTPDETDYLGGFFEGNWVLDACN